MEIGPLEIMDNHSKIMPFKMFTLFPEPVQPAAKLRIAQQKFKGAQNEIIMSAL